MAIVVNTEETKKLRVHDGRWNFEMFSVLFFSGLPGVILWSWSRSSGRRSGHSGRSRNGREQ